MVVLNETQIIEDARSLTGYHDELIDDAEMHTLYHIAVEDIEGIVRRPMEEIENEAAERAVFWAVCLFSKIHMGELDGLDFSIGSINVKQMPIRDITRIWYRQMDLYINVLRSESATGITQISRSDREYGTGVMDVGLE